MVHYLMSVSYTHLFKKYKEGTQSDSANTTGPLLNLTENDVWYSKEDFTTDTNRYKLSLYDNYMELHSLDEKAAKMCIRDSLLSL